MIVAELAKLRRSSLWVVAVVLPLLAVVTGTVNYGNNQGMLSAGWVPFWSQVVLFYGMLFMSMGVAVLASAAWRMEHRDHNWNLLMTSPVRPSSITGAKIAALTMMVAVMQAVLLTLMLVVGTFVLGLEGRLPWEQMAVALLALVAAVPVAALQSLLSMLTRSFVAPIAVGLLGCVGGVGVLLGGGGGALSYLVPQSLVTSALFLGNSAVNDSAGLDMSVVGGIVLSTVALTGVFWALSTILLARRESR